MEKIVYRNCLCLAALLIFISSACPQKIGIFDGQEEVVPGMHPPYKHVFIRHMSITGGTPKVIAYL